RTVLGVLKVKGRVIGGGVVHQFDLSILLSSSESSRLLRLSVFPCYTNFNVRIIIAFAFNTSFITNANGGSFIQLATS
ncbi:5275_t:CDS:1, partial [Funneliformis caledonium]